MNSHLLIQKKKILLQSPLLRLQTFPSKFHVNFTFINKSLHKAVRFFARELSDWIHPRNQWMLSLLWVRTTSHTDCMLFLVYHFALHSKQSNQSIVTFRIELITWANLRMRVSSIACWVLLLSLFFNLEYLNNLSLMYLQTFSKGNRRVYKWLHIHQNLKFNSKNYWNNFKVHTTRQELLEELLTALQQYWKWSLDWGQGS